VGLPVRSAGDPEEIVVAFLGAGFVTDPSNSELPEAREVEETPTPAPVPDVAESAPEVEIDEAAGPGTLESRVDDKPTGSVAPEPAADSHTESAGDAEPAADSHQEAEADAEPTAEVGQSEEVSEGLAAEPNVTEEQDVSVPVDDVEEIEAEEDVEGIILEEPGSEELQKEWFILKVQVNREDSIRDALIRRIKIEGLEEYFGDIVVPTEDVAEFNKSGKRRIVKRKLYPGYLLVNMTITDDTWFLVRETPGVGDFTGSAGKPTPMDPREVERILRLGATEEEGGGQVKTAIPFKIGDRVRVKDGNFQNFEGDVESIDEANGRITVVITIFNRSTPVELEHWQLESV